jgi:3-phosphoshikimate 1-carboxyvinyltransferase
MIDPQGLRFRIEPGGRLRGRVRVPGDKSISHRSVMLGALAEGVTRVEGFLEGADNLATVNAFRAMGVTIEGPHRGLLRIEGVGMHGLNKPGSPLDLGNSGTSMRLLSGLLAGQSFDTELTGDLSLCSRPMGRVTKPLQGMGARVDANAKGTAPLRIHGACSLVGIDYPMPVASAQVKSCLLLAGMYARGRTCVHEPAPTRDHTERMLCAFGYPVERDGARVCISGGGTLRPTRIQVPGDFSSAAFFLVGATISPGSEIVLEEIGLNENRTGALSILRTMGADIEVERRRTLGAEPVADIRVRSSPLRGIHIPEEQVPRAIDELPALLVAAACARGETILSGAAELRVKESDRIQSMAEGLAVLGIEAIPREDGIVIRGGGLGGGEIRSRGDHRIAMAFAMAGLVSRSPIRIRECANVQTSFPGFARIASATGLRIRAETENG